jgi:choloylglycine hydrolase
MKAILMILLCVSSVFACTDFQIVSSDNSIINGRSMEFGPETNSKLIVHPRGERFISSSPVGSETMRWNSKYGFVGLDVFGINTTVDGLNEKGLSVGVLWFPGAIYEPISPGTKNVVEVTDLSNWMLGNFASVDEVRSALSNTTVWGAFNPVMKMIPPVHFAVHDSNGKNLVIEFVNGQKNIYDNPNGVLTNTPTFDWHITNLRNYLYLRSQNVNPLTFGKLVLEPTGEGTGMLGIPGDWTPPSRFIRATAFVHYAKKPVSAKEGVNLAQHILNTVDIPKGDITSNGQTADYTQWAVVKDLTNKVFYFRSYDSMSPKSVDLKKINFNSQKKRSIPVDESSIVDVTNRLR